MKSIITSQLNPNLVVKKDNKPEWYLPETRRDGYRNLHKINRYGLLYRSDYVLTLNENYKPEVEKLSSVKKMTNHKYFCSLIVGKGQDILYEKYASDFSKSTPQTIMSITKMLLLSKTWYLKVISIVSNSKIPKWYHFPKRHFRRPTP